MGAMKNYTQQPITRKRQRTDVRRRGNVISVDFGREVRERQQCRDAAKLRRENLIDGAIIILVVAGLVSLMLNVIRRVLL